MPKHPQYGPHIPFHSLQKCLDLTRKHLAGVVRALFELQTEREFCWVFRVTDLKERRANSIRVFRAILIKVNPVNVPVARSAMLSLGRQGIRHRVFRAGTQHQASLLTAR